MISYLQWFPGVGKTILNDHSRSCCDVEFFLFESLGIPKQLKFFEVSVSDI